MKTQTLTTENNLKTASDRRPHILDYSLPQWLNFVQTRGHKNFRARQIFTWLHKNLAQSSQEMNNLPQDLKTALQEDFIWPMPQPLVSFTCTEDSTARYLFKSGEHRIESVWLPQDTRKAACVSVQQGCSFDCSFCATGKIPFGGNLSSGEILAQVYLLSRLQKQKITNVVFMGMGEPLINYQASLQAAHMLNNPAALDIGKRRITFSSVGYLPGIKRFIEEKQPFNLAISVHSLHAPTRRKIMKAEEQYPLTEVLVFLEQHRKNMRKNQLTLEYILIENINMQTKDAHDLAQAAKHLQAKINLIPLNTSFAGFVRPSEKKIDAFWQILQQAGVVAVNRHSAGQKIEAACGMLAGGNDLSAHKV